jgi:beta-glucosidase
LVKKAQVRPLYLDSARAVLERIQDLMARMNLEEKLAQLTSYWFNDLQINREPSPEKMRSLLGSGIGQISRIGGSSTLPPRGVAHAGNVIQHFLMEQTRLGIPAILHEECCLGYLGLGGTIFPQMIGLASSWNPDLVRRITTEIRRQMLAIGARQGLGPVLDIGCDPRWGRVEETFGEDPLLVTRFGVAYIRGLQGEEKQSGVLATAKHFAAHSIPAGGLNCAPVQLGPRALWETFLMPYQGAIREAGVRSVMNAYHELDGEVVAASRAIMTDLLRGSLGFDGLVVSDYSAISMLQSFHHITTDLRTAAALALRAGIDLELPSRKCYGEPLRAALENGDVSGKDIDTAVGRILQAKFELGLFENPYVDEGAVEACFETAPQRVLAGEAARQSIVLLKNDGVLPLAKLRTIAVIGPNANVSRNLIGDYSYLSMSELLVLHPIPGLGNGEIPNEEQIHTHSVKIATILEAIQVIAGAGTQVTYAPGCGVTGSDRSGFEDAARLASQADVTILVLGDKSGLVPDCTCGETRDRAELGLPGVQEELAKAVVATGKPVVVVMVNGRPLSITWLADNASAILEAWLPGEEGGAAVAAVLFGAVNPGGKLPVSIARSAGQIPLTYNHTPSGGHSNWYGDYMDLPAGPLYAFGHGLSYTTFEYSDLQISPEKAISGGRVDISLSVNNTGKVAGDEVVQLYVCDESSSVPRPVIELKGFYRITLRPGERRKLTFHLPVNLLAFYDTERKLIVEAGTVRISLGSSSADLRLSGSLEIVGHSPTEIAERVLECPVTVE